MSEVSNMTQDQSSVSDSHIDLPQLDFHWPRYDELPDKLMFLDEIVEFIGQVHACIPISARNGKKFTTAMASNYIKSGLTDPPIGKRYTRDHMCLIFFASSLKMVYTAEQVIALSKRLFRDRPIAEVNDEFAVCVEHAIKSISATLAPGECKHEIGNSSDPLLDVVAYAFASHAISLMALI